MDIMQMRPEDFGPVPWQCWDAPGFKECNTEAGHRANRFLVSAGGKPGTPEWDIVYREQLRREVYRCQILSNCVPASIAEDLRKKTGGATDADILSRLEAQQSQFGNSDTRWTWLLFGLGGVGVLYFLHKRSKA